jgi:hypothetical protein
MQKDRLSKNAERQAEYRKRRLDLGETEVRGIYAKTEIHKHIKDKIKQYIKLKAPKND